MQVRVRFFAALRERAGAEALSLEDLPEPLDVGGLKRILAERYPELGSLEGVRGVLDNTWVRDAEPLRPGAELALLPPVSGGAPDTDAELEAGLFELSGEPIDPALCQARVEHPSCGAVVLFSGLTRERNRQQEVARLDYEAFAEMVGVEMARIFDECRDRFGPGASGDRGRVLRMVCVHRTGTVGVGEPSIAIAVASPHRDAAFGACRFLIDELKTRVPLWKKEVYRDGHHWINDRS